MQDAQAMRTTRGKSAEKSVYFEAQIARSSCLWCVGKGRMMHVKKMREKKNVNIYVAYKTKANE